MKKNLLWGILIVVVILVVSVSIYMFGKAGEKPIGSVVDASRIEKIGELQQRGDLDTAIKEANIYLKSDPNNTGVLIRLAECYASKGDLTLAEETVKKALVINEKDSWSLRALAAIYRQQFETQKDDNLKKKYLDLAQVEIEKDSALSPDDPWVNAEAAQIYFYQGNKTKATSAIDSALKVEPKSQFLENIKTKIQSMP